MHLQALHLSQPFPVSQPDTASGNAFSAIISLRQTVFSVPLLFEPPFLLHRKHWFQTAGGIFLFLPKQIPLTGYFSVGSLSIVPERKQTFLQDFLLQAPSDLPHQEQNYHRYLL